MASHPLAHTRFTPAAVNLAWSVHPFRQNPARGVIGLIVMGCFAASAGIFANAVGAPLAESIAWAILSLGVLFVSLGNFFLPSRYAMDGDGILVHHLFRKRRMRWEEVRRFVVDKHGGYLSTRARASRLDAFRGLHIRFSSDRQEIVATIRSLVAERSEFMVHYGGSTSQDTSKLASGSTLGRHMHSSERGNE